MVSIQKIIPLNVGSSPNLFTINITNGTYVELSNPTYVYIDPADYTNPTFYYETVLAAQSGSTAYCALYTKSGSVVSGSEVTTTSTTPVRLRSGAITLTADEYTTRLKNSSVANSTFYGDRIIVNQTAQNILKTETQIPLFYSNGTTPSSTTYADIATIFNSYFLNTAANWDGTTTIYLEATMKTTAGNAFVQLTTFAGSAVSSSETTTSSTTYARARSSALTLADATTYKAQAHKDGGNSMTINSARLIIKQTGNITKTECYLPLGLTLSSQGATGGSYLDTTGRLYFEPSAFSVNTIAYYHELSTNSNTSSGAQRIYDVTNSAVITNSTVSNTNAVTRYRSSALSMPADAALLREEGDSAAGTVYTAIQSIVAVVTMTLDYSNAFIIFNTL